MAFQRWMASKRQIKARDNKKRTIVGTIRALLWEQNRVDAMGEIGGTETLVLLVRLIVDDRNGCGQARERLRDIFQLLNLQGRV